MATTDGAPGAPTENIVKAEENAGIRLASLAALNDKLSVKLERADANKDGIVDAAEIAGIIDEMVKEAHMKRVYKFMTIGLFIVVAVLIGALTGITYGIVELAKDTKVSHYNSTTFQFMTTRDGAAAVTGGASLHLADFLVLPTANLSSGSRRMLQAAGSQQAYYGTVSRATVVAGCNILGNGIASFVVTKPLTAADSFTGSTSNSVSTVSVNTQSGCGEGRAINAQVQVNGDTMQVVCDSGSSTCDIFISNSAANTTNVNATITNATANAAGRHLLSAGYKSSVPNHCGTYDIGVYDGSIVYCCTFCYQNRDVENCGCASCFPAGATVSVLGRGVVAMEALRYGDMVLSRDRASGALVHRPVYLFGHREAQRLLPYVHISAAGRTLALTAGHFAPVCVEDCTRGALESGRARMEYRYGGDIRVGDVMLVARPTPEFVTVEQVDIVQARGAFNPYVRGADLIVDGVVASPHSNWILDSSAPAWLVPHLPAIYEAMLAPVYGLYRLVGPVTAEWLAHGLGLVDGSGHSAAGYVQVLAAMALPAAAAAAAAHAASKRLTARRSA